MSTRAPDWMDRIDAERRALARDLHDDLGQILSALRLSAHALSGALVDDPRETLADDVVVLADAALARVRAVSHGLHPPLLASQGLAAALQGLADGIPLGEVEVRFEAESDLPRPTHAVEIAAYRIAQEALTNALRHAQARSVRIELRAERDALQLQIIDNGHGHDLDAASGFGRTAMRERAALASIDFAESASADGTRITLRLPLAGRDAD
ncbi:histidine kinase [Luteimonas fraxinea]|uniref:Histidine kinase n=1 Tax=Luteimonas fraxinea TaxID=2901869 RepID=A0ABS8U765_9GAMM|nr:histidine kinase [Luteimonas fraxinea]MCD9095541.1 histidine kinase [Luteimonas fraxinea]MCD9126218.1 histidine kinase [Luteimonas fraxinea]UHH11258.1 histidine kinase [Luteimonas fraxinea]